MTHGAPISAIVERVCRHEIGRVVATLTRVLGDVSLAEEMAQDALLSALERWPATGVPESPGAWLMTTAKNRALDHLRRQRMTSGKEDALTWHEEHARGGAPKADELEPVADDPLRLIFTCCHPALLREGQVALTLRLMGGLTTPEIARAFLVPEATVAQRIVRAKRTLRDLAIPYEIPERRELPERLPAVLAVVYLVFNEGYSAAFGDALIRSELCDEAIRLGTVLMDLMPSAPEPLGLLALMEIQASRAAARVSPEGEMVLLLDQDRSLWDRARIERGLTYLSRAVTLPWPGAYVAEACIAACHARARSAAETDWRAIGEAYDSLLEIAPSPVVELNRAVAVSMVEGGLSRALSIVDDLTASAALGDYHLLPAVRADILRRLGRHQEAARAYETAMQRASNVREREFLLRRRTECEALAAANA